MAFNVRAFGAVTTIYAILFGMVLMITATDFWWKTYGVIIFFVQAPLVYWQLQDKLRD